MNESSTGKKRAKVGASAVLFAALGVACAKEPADLPEVHVPACANRSCGDPCVACPQGDPGCGPEAVVRACDMQGDCMPAPVECSPP